MKNAHKNSTFVSFLVKEDLLEQAEAAAVKRVITYEIERSMKKNHMSKKKMADMMHTSRSALDRLLDQYRGDTAIFSESGTCCW